MRTQTFESVCQSDYNLKYLDTLKQFWFNDKTFSCLHQPKKQSLLLYLDGCKAKYVDKEGKEYFAEPNDVIYTAQGCEYAVSFYDFQSNKAGTIGVNFHILSEDNERIIFSEPLKIFKNVNENVREAFEILDKKSKDGNTRIAECKIHLLSILNALDEKYSKNKHSSFLEEGVRYLRAHYTENPSVAFLAKLCHVSEVYFRKLFKEEFSLTPLEYKNALRLKKAKQYLKFSDLSVQEISESLGYATVSHFIKQFKAAFSISPLQYKNLRT